MMHAYNQTYVPATWIMQLVPEWEEQIRPIAQEVLERFQEGERQSAVVRERA